MPKLPSGLKTRETNHIERSPWGSQVAKTFILPGSAQGTQTENGQRNSEFSLDLARVTDSPPLKPHPKLASSGHNGTGQTLGYEKLVFLLSGGTSHDYIRKVRSFQESDEHRISLGQGVSKWNLSLACFVAQKSLPVEKKIILLAVVVPLAVYLSQKISTHRGYFINTHRFSFLLFFGDFAVLY